MLKLLGLVAVVWVALMPPLFTAGACTREFEAEALRVEADRKRFETTASARQYWTERAVPHRFLSVESCRRARLHWLESCGPGPVLYAQVPVANAICRIYRDDSIVVQMHFTEKERLQRLQVDMRPYRTLPLPFAEAAIHWAR